MEILESELKSNLHNARTKIITNLAIANIVRPIARAGQEPSAELQKRFIALHWG